MRGWNDEDVVAIASGCGKRAESFKFNANGVWTVTLKFANNTTRTAHVDIQAVGLTLIVK